jgi:hypothetical protein
LWFRLNPAVALVVGPHFAVALRIRRSAGSNFAG